MQTLKKNIYVIFLFLWFVTPIEARTFKIATYNVENFFDFTRDYTEYPEYIPGSKYGWTRDMFDIKTANIARVINDLKADIIALQEVESKKVLLSLQERLRVAGMDYPYYAIADSRKTTLKCAVLSVFPIKKRKEIRVDNDFARNILEVAFDIDGNDLYVFINHWKSRRGPESQRIIYAKALLKEINKFNDNTDFIITGDFNSCYDEYKTFRNCKKLNNTNGITGINHILMTIKGFEPVTEKILTEQKGNAYLYNLWLEIRTRRRWSYNFFGKKTGLDNIIVSRGLYDKNGISYIDNSFDKFDPDYLFKDRRVYRWQRASRGKGKHLGYGYSDHLPIFAYFSTGQ